MAALTAYGGSGCETSGGVRGDGGYSRWCIIS
jgi:hypothetical protein